MSTIVQRYEFDTSDLGNDTSGNNLDLTNTDVTLVTDPELGPVASFNGTTSTFTRSGTFSLFSGLTGPRTYATWFKLTGTANMHLFSYGDRAWSITVRTSGVGINLRGGSSSFRGASIALDRWYHLAATYDGTVGTIVYLNGVNVHDLGQAISFVGEDTLGIGFDIWLNRDYFSGFMSDFRVYDSIIPQSEIETLVSSRGLPNLFTTPRVINIVTEVVTVPGATAYEITYEGPTGGEIVAFTGTTDLEYNIVNVEPETLYTVKLYADTGAGFQLIEQSTATTLANVAANYNIFDFRVGIVFDLSSFNSSTLALMSPVIPDLFSTGNVVGVSLASNPELTNISFVASGGTLNITTLDGVLLPFHSTLGAGQTASVTLNNGTTVPITYDETTNSIIIDSVSYTSGDSLVLSQHAIEVFDYNGLTIISSVLQPIFTETVTWTIDANGNYEISSKNHLLQLMNEGLIFTDAGDFPSDYLATGTNYIQTVDIDLLGDSTHIRPIEIFSGNYDGNFHEISNWSYTDPNVSTGSTLNSQAGLFGFISGSIIQNIRLSGVYTMNGFRQQGGFLVGESSLSTICNIEADFSEGTTLANGGATGALYIGGLFGRTRRCSIYGITLRGTIDMDLTDDLPYGALRIGGIVGFLDGQSGETHTCSFVRNMANFPSGLHGRYAGGIVGEVDDMSVTYALNAMQGDIVNELGGGGVIGRADMANEGSCHHLVNSMIGNILFSDTSSNNFRTAGVIGELLWSEPTSHIFNYMTGDVIHSTTLGCGLIGTINPSNVVITQSYNAMNGTASRSFVGLATSSTIEGISLTTFGLTFDTNTDGITPVTGTVLTDTTLNLPYFDFEGTDTHGNSYSWDFVFGNLPGNSTFNIYTHASLHKQDVSAPFSVDFDILETNTTTFLTYSNINDSTVFTDDTLVVLSVSDGVIVTNYAGTVVLFSPPLMTFVPRPINIFVTVEEVALAGATSYTLTYQNVTDGDEVTVVNGQSSTVLVQNVRELEPDTEYTMRLYAGSGTSTLLGESNVSTLTNIAANYVISDFGNDDGSFSLRDLGTSLGFVSNVLGDLFNTGDRIRIPPSAGNQIEDANFVDLGETINVRDARAVLVPFDSAGGASQSISLELTDDVTTVGVDFDDTNNCLTVEGVTYKPGDYFIIEL